MASPANSNGLRRAIDVLAETSLHLVEQVVFEAISAPTIVGGDLQVSVPSLTGLYPGAEVVVGWQSSTAEVLTVISTTPTPANPGPGTVLLSAPANVHVAGETILGATFPTQQPTDPLWRQQELLDYLGRAQNDFLHKVPLIISQPALQLLAVGQQYQATPPTSIEMERVSVANGLAATAIIASISRASNVVTCVLTAPAPSPQFTQGLGIQVLSVTDSSFDSVATPTSLGLFAVATSSQDGLTLTWPQTGANASSSGGILGPPLLTRLYESSQEQLTMRDPAWQSNPSSLPPTNWYEDRTGVYQWGVAAIPRGSFYAETLTSIRDTETLSMLDGFLLPDIFIPYVKYGVLASAWSKDGEQRSPTLARFCQGRFDFGVMLAERFLRNVVTKTGQNVFGAAAQAAGGR